MPWRTCGMMPKSPILRTEYLRAASYRAIGTIILLKVIPLKAGRTAIFLLMLAFMSCDPAMKSRAEPPRTSTHTPVSPSADKAFESAPVYVESAGFASDTTGTYIRISGHLPTPCHHLAPPERSTVSDTLQVALHSWQKAGVICAQVLEPFVYYMKIAPYGEPVPAHICVNDERAGQ